MRLEGWENEFSLYIDKTMSKEFEWGVCDCLIFVSDSARIISGVDPMSYQREGDPETIRGAYSTAHGAIKLIKAYRKDLNDVIDACFKRIGVKYARRGDIVMTKLDQGDTLGVVVDGGKAFFKMNDMGFHVENVSNCEIAWRVD